jgi:hypothetical protein
MLSGSDLGIGPIPSQAAVCSKGVIGLEPGKTATNIWVDGASILWPGGFEWWTKKVLIYFRAGE